MILPVGDVNPTRRRAWLTLGIVTANIVVFFAVQPAADPCAELQFLFRWAAIPEELLTLRELEPFRVGGCVVGADDKSVLLSAVSAMFLHADILHLAGNLLFLWIFGNNVEDRLGHGQFAIFYLVGGLAATYAFALLNAGEITPLLGASGAVAAVLGAYFLMFPRAPVRTYVPFPLYLLAVLVRARITFWFLFFAVVELPAWVVLGFWFALQLRDTAAPVAQGIAFSAHVAGFVAGIVLTLVMNGTRAHPRRASHAWDR